MKIKVDQEKLTAVINLFEKDFKSNEKLLDEIFIFADRKGKTIENVNEYLKVFSNKFYEIDWSKQDDFINEVDTHAVNIKFFIK